MREVIVQAFDDLYLRDNRRVPAERTLLVGLNGQWAELDLAEDNYRKIMESVRPLLEAGHSPERPAALPPASSGRGPRSPREKAAVREYNKAMREWANERPGYNITLKEGKPNTYYYPRKLREDYAAYLAALENTGQPH